MIEIKNLTKKYGAHTALQGISFEIREKEILGFLGRNGAGKTTTMNIIAGYIPSTSGSVWIDGIDMRQSPSLAKRKIGYLPEQPPLYVDMTVTEYLRFAGALKGLSPQACRAQMDKIAQAVSLQDVLPKLIRSLSKGYRQRVGIAQALMGEPRYIILDEPTVGLDPMQIVDMRNTIRQLATHCSVVLSSHILHDVADVCERIVIIHQGRIVEQGSIAALMAKAGSLERLLVRARHKDTPKVLAAIAGVTGVETLGESEKDSSDYLLHCEAGTDLREQITRCSVENGLALLMLRPVDASLEDVFLRSINER